MGYIPLCIDKANGEIYLLLQRRSVNKKSYPNCWALCAGHVVGKQTVQEAAVMEANEELGLSLKESDLRLLVEKTRNDRNDNRCFATCFYGFYDKDFPFVKQDEEVEELRWFSLKDFEKMVKSGEKCIFKDNDYYRAIVKKIKIILEMEREF